MRIILASGAIFALPGLLSSAFGIPTTEGSIAKRSDNSTASTIAVKDAAQTGANQASWCTLHYIQVKSGALSAGPNKLTVYGPKNSTENSPPQLGWSNPYVDNGAINVLPGYGDFLVAVNNPGDSVTFLRHGSVSKDTWTVQESDSGQISAGQCNVGAWAYHSSRSMDCGFSCTLIVDLGTS